MRRPHQPESGHLFEPALVPAIDKETFFEPVLNQWRDLVDTTLRMVEENRTPGIEISEAAVELIAQGLRARIWKDFADKNGQPFVGFFFLCCAPLPHGLGSRDLHALNVVRRVLGTPGAERLLRRDRHRGLSNRIVQWQRDAFVKARELELGRSLSQEDWERLLADIREGLGGGKARNGPQRRLSRLGVQDPGGWRGKLATAEEPPPDRRSTDVGGADTALHVP